MSDSPDPTAEQAELVDRLRALGQTPVDPAVASAHLTAITAVLPTGAKPRIGRERFVRVKVAAAFAAGLVLGSTGLASAGVLGSTPQNAVADAAAQVGVDLPGGTARSTEGCGGRTYKNHGEFVSQGGDPHSQCGKPVKSKTDNANQPDKTPGAGAGHGCGKPPWAGKGNHAKKTEAAVAAREADCGNDSGEPDQPDAKRPTPTTSAHSSAPTTAPATSTTTATPNTTTPVSSTTTPASSTTTPASTTTTT
jgi:hypothetical protein